MAGFDYARSAATADRLITRFGVASSGAAGSSGYRAIRRMVPGSGPAHNPGPATPVDHPCTMVVVGFDKNEINGTSILSTDKKILVAPGTIDIEIVPGTDSVVIADQVLTIVPPVGVLKPADTVVLWTLQCRE